MAEPGIVILGSGSLARSICYSLATLCATKCVVTVVSTTPQNSAEVCYVADVRAASSGTPVRFRALSVDRYTTESISAILRQSRPRIVLNCASYQSPWEKTRSPSAWTALTGRAGFGLTLPLQAAVAIEAASAIIALAPRPLFLNACFPDAVNPLLKALGLPIFCGVGNVALLAASLRESLRPARGEQLQVLGHHWHLHTPDDDADDALAWLDGTPVREVGPLLRRQRAADRSELNAVTGHVTALLLADLVIGREVRTSLPGPLGLPGGYPVRIRERSLTLELPADMPRAQAVALNRAWAQRDGVSIEESGEVRFSTSASLAIRSELPEFPGSVHARDVPELCSRLLELRGRLRRSQAPSTGHR
ncbi:MULTISPECIES: hypothetical protein [unclassified Nonomuraea]|uniref:hypothetical protein n=1 Tax=unclassified Nonomuraea TaxID=2593643 RepID=UPI0033FCCAF5